MEACFLRAGGIDIAYYEKNRQALHSIFFIHGNSTSSRAWRKQIGDPLLRDYRLVALDLPAHGLSGEAAQSLYTLPHLAAIMALAVKQLADDKPYIIAGVSLGTNIVSEMPAFGLTPLGLVFAGPSIVGARFPVEKIIRAGTHVNVVFTDDPDPCDVKKYAGETSASMEDEDLRLFLEDFEKVKKPFRTVLFQSITDMKYSDEVKLLREKNIPLLVIFGKDEKIINNNYLDGSDLSFWRNTIFQVPGASHLVPIDQPASFNQLMKEFATDIFR